MTDDALPGRFAAPIRDGDPVPVNRGSGGVDIHALLHLAADRVALSPRMLGTNDAGKEDQLPARHCGAPTAGYQTAAAFKPPRPPAWLSGHPRPRARFEHGQTEERGEQRIAILGAGGAGKTVLARQLGQLLGLPVAHLDQLRYEPDWNLVPEAAFTAAQQRLVAGEAWIIDGNSLASLPIRATRADTIIVLDPHPVVCLTGILRRRLQYGGGQHADGVYNRISPEVVKYVLLYRWRHLPRALAAARENGSQAELIHLTSRRAADQLIRQIRTASSPGRP